MVRTWEILWFNVRLFGRLHISNSPSLVVAGKHERQPNETSSHISKTDNVRHQRNHHRYISKQEEKEAEHLSSIKGFVRVERSDKLLPGNRHVETATPKKAAKQAVGLFIEKYNTFVLYIQQENTDLQMHVKPNTAIVRETHNTGH